MKGFKGLLLAAVFAAAAVTAFGGIVVSVAIAPPVLPVYTQPLCPGPDYIWTPGYWAYGDEGYFWVPGTWVLAPRPGLLWTPGYWGWGGGVYLWHAGYWGPHVGFYGGVNYGFGYGGVGFVGGMWAGEHFRYNTAVTRVNTTVIHNTYVNNTVINNNHTSFNGGSGGLAARPNAEERSYEREQHSAPTAVQRSHENGASTNRANFASVNHGNPEHAAVSRPTQAVNGGGNQPARNYTEKGPIQRGGNQPAAVNREGGNRPNNIAPQNHVAPQSNSAPQNHVNGGGNRGNNQEHAAPKEKAAPEHRGEDRRGEEGRK